MTDGQDTRHTDEQLRQIADLVGLHPDERTPQARGVASMAKALLDLRARVAELEVALEAKKSEHAETLGYLEQAQRVIDRDSAAYGRLLRVLWQSRRRLQECTDGLISAHHTAREIAIGNSHALDEAKDEIWQLRKQIAFLEEPPRQIETAEQLDALPIETVVLAVRSRTTWENIAERDSLWANCGAALTAANLLHNYGAVVVVWTPKQVQR